MGKRELVALLCLSSWCLMIVVWLFFTMPGVCLQFLIAVFFDHSLTIFGVKVHLYYSASILPHASHKGVLNAIKS